MQGDSRPPWMICLAALLALAAAQLACVAPGVSTSASLEQSVAATASAQAVTSLSSGDAVGTAEALATLDAAVVEATQIAEISVGTAANAATAEAIAPILAQLPLFGVDPSAGQVAWIHPPVDLDLEGYMQTDAANQFGGTVAGDFVLSAEIGWDTQYGTSGCGFALRSDGNRDKPNQYMLLASRGGSGHINFLTLANGQMANSRDLFPRTSDATFDAQNGGVNRITVVARGLQFTIYTNGVKIGVVTGGEAPTRPVLPTLPALPAAPALPAVSTQVKQTLDAQETLSEQAEAAFQGQRRVFEQNNTRYDKGFIAMLAMNESGATHCHFEDAWLFLIEE